MKNIKKVYYLLQIVSKQCIGCSISSVKILDSRFVRDVTQSFTEIKNPQPFWDFNWLCSKIENTYCERAPKHDWLFPQNVF